MIAAITPRPLVIGDRVAVVAPSSPVKAEALAQGLAVIESWGLNATVIGDPIANPGGGSSGTYLAGSDAQRAKALQDALSQPEFRAVFLARGGYGAMRLLEDSRELLLVAARAKDRWLIGSSDATALHLALGDHPGLVYGPMPGTAAFSGQNADALRALLFGETTHSTLPGRALVAGIAQGPLIGGCLSLMAALSGTSFFPDLQGRILILEDVGERPYRIDRLLTTLRLAGVLRGVAGIACGSLEDCGMSDEDADALVLDRLSDLGVPVIAGLGFGHGAVQRPLPLHAAASIESTDVNATLTWRRPAAASRSSSPGFGSNLA